MAWRLEIMGRSVVVSRAAACARVTNRGLPVVDARVSISVPVVLAVTLEAEAQPPGLAVGLHARYRSHVTDRTGGAR